MTSADDPVPYVPRELPREFLEEHRANFRWLSALRAAVSRGLTDRDAIEEANDSVPEALEPSRFPDGKPGGRVNPPTAPPSGAGSEREASPAPEFEFHAFLAPPVGT